MIIDYDGTIGHGRGYPTGLSHEEKMDVVACLLDEGERTYVMKSILHGFHKIDVQSVKW